MEKRGCVCTHEQVSLRYVRTSHRGRVGIAQVLDRRPCVTCVKKVFGEEAGNPEPFIPMLSNTNRGLPIGGWILLGLIVLVGIAVGALALLSPGLDLFNRILLIISDVVAEAFVFYAAFYQRKGG